MDWHNPHTRARLKRALTEEAFNDLGRPALAILRGMIAHRNAVTGQCNPSRARLGREGHYQPRAVSMGTAQLVKLDLITKAQARCRGGWTSTNEHGFRPEFFERAERAHMVRTGCKSSPPRAANESPPPPAKPADKGDPPDPVSPDRSQKGKVPPARSRAVSPLVQQEAPDPDFAALAAVFYPARAAHYGDNDGGTVRADGQARIAGWLVELLGEASAWASTHGVPFDRATVRRELCGRIVSEWLAWPGSTGLLVDKRHPIGLLPGDLHKVGPAALEGWKRSARRAMPAPVRVAPVELDPPPAVPAEDVRPAIAEFRARLGLDEPAQAARESRDVQSPASGPDDVHGEQTARRARVRSRWRLVLAVAELGDAGDVGAVGAEHVEPEPPHRERLHTRASLQFKPFGEPQRPLLKRRR